MDCIFLEGVTLRGHHGVYSEETRLGQRFVFDVACYLDFATAPDHDDVSDTVNYEAIYAVLERIATGEPVHLIETLAEHIADALFSAFGRVQRIDVTVTKPEAPLPMVAGRVGVRISRQRPA
ncbi:MAG: dihydroneopterin aldolase [Pseudomonadota bacterium]